MRGPARWSTRQQPRIRAHRRKILIVPPVVLIEMPEADRASPLARALVNACSQGVAQGHCALATDAEEPDVMAVAIVRWEDVDRRAVSLTVGVRRVSRSQWLSRSIEFRQSDALTERWRAVGLVIATLAGEAEARAREVSATPDARGSNAVPSASTGAPGASAPPSAAANVASAPATDEVAASTPSTSTRRPARERAWIDAGGLLDPGVGDAWLRGGGWLRASYRPSAIPIYAHLGGRYAVAPAVRSELSLAWASGSAGAGTVIAFGALPVRMEFHAEAVAQLVRVDARDTDAARSETRDRFVWGGRGGMDVAWHFAPAWGLVGGGELNVLSSGTVVRVANQREGRDASVSAGFLLGARAVLR